MLFSQKWLRFTYMIFGGIEILESKGRLVIRAKDFYMKAGLNKTHYGRWLEYYIFPVAQVTDECWAADDNHIPIRLPGEMTGRGTRPYRNYSYYFSIPFAKSLCIWLKTKEAYSLRGQLNIISKMECVELELFFQHSIQSYKNELKNALLEIENRDK